MRHLTAQWRVTAGRRAMPTEGMFALGQGELDPRVFDGDRLKPEVRDGVLGLLDAFWTPKYGDWRQWARVYLAGSAASHWWDSDTDLDILIGINKPVLDRVRPANAEVTEADVAGHFNVELNAELETTTLHWHGAKTQFHVNPGSWNILDINPYAAYDITNDRWVQRSPELPADWGPHYFPEAWWDKVNDVADWAEELMSREDEVERIEDGAAMFDLLYQERQKAYTTWGKGWVDYGNFQYQVLSQWGVLQPLYRAKQAWKEIRP